MRNTLTALTELLVKQQHVFNPYLLHLDYGACSPYKPLRNGCYYRNDNVLKYAHPVI